MAKYDVDDEFLDQLKGGIKKLMEIISSHKQSDGAITSLAQSRAREGGSSPEQMDAHVYMHKKMLKKAISDHRKASENGQGGPGFQNPNRPANMPMQAPQSVANMQRMMHSIGAPRTFPQGPSQQMMGPIRGPMANPQKTHQKMPPVYQGNVQ